MTNTPKFWRLILIAIMLVIAIIVTLAIWLSPRPLVIWNASKSVPVGWYFVEHRKPKLHEIAVVKLDNWPELYASSRGYLPTKVWLLKPVLGLPSAVVCRFGRYVFVDGKMVARAKLFDLRHRILARWAECHTLNPDEVFLIARPKNSFDSRYFGPVKLSQVIGVAHRLHFPLE
ncbi:MAG: S26 family signal peptidase [Pseudomonadota bacterium]|nr:S26 family signal peptidase [Pseudomonadota bacterium]